MRASIRAGIERAAGYGLVAEREVSTFIDLLVIFGIDFDRRLPWAREILTDPASIDPAARVHALRRRAEVEA